jgi:hypothetical protein
VVRLGRAAAKSTTSTPALRRNVPGSSRVSQRSVTHGRSASLPDQCSLRGRGLDGIALPRIENAEDDPAHQQDPDATMSTILRPVAGWGRARRGGRLRRRRSRRPGARRGCGRARVTGLLGKDGRSLVRA